MRRVLCGLVVAVLLGACVAHEKNGDRAAVLGDWKAAYGAYRTALAEEPNDAALRSKYEQARARALEEAQRRAQACAQGGDWGCALAEADFALSLEPGEAGMGALRARAATQVALQGLDVALEQVRRGQVEEALAQLERSSALSREPEVAARAEGVRREALVVGRKRVEVLRREKDYDAALALAGALAPLDAGMRDRVLVLERERERFRAEEYERLAREGDAARAQRQWALAHQHYQAALKMAPGGRAAPLAQYTRHVEHAEREVLERHWSAATECYRRALQTGQDDGWAARRLEEVELRPYRVSLRSVLVVPTRPDGRAWVGTGGPLFYRLARQVMDQAERRGGVEALEEAATYIPVENRPSLRVEVTLPDGGRLTTPARPGVYVPLDAEWVVMANALDEGRLTLRVLMEGAGGSESLGALDVTLNELVGQRELRLRHEPILALRLAVVPAPGREPGTFAGMSPVGSVPGEEGPGRPAGHGGAPTPSPGSRPGRPGAPTAGRPHP